MDLINMPKIIEKILRVRLILYLLSRVSPRLSFLYYISRYNNGLDGIDALNYYFKKNNLAEISKIDSSKPLYIDNIRPCDSELPPRHVDLCDKLVSIIITSYNDVDFIHSSVMSIIGQSYKNIEIIIIDDNSNDGTFEVLLDIKKKYDYIKLIKMTKNHGTYVAKNIGLKNSKGDYITFQDSDDWSHPNRLSEHLHEHNDKNSSVSISSLVRITSSGMIVSRGDYLIDRMCHISMMFNRSVIDTNGYFMTSRIGNDSEFLARIIINTDTTYIRIKKVLMFCSSRPGSLTTAKDTNINSDIRIKSQIEWQNWHNELRINKQVGRIDFNEKDYDWKIIK